MFCGIIFIIAVLLQDHPTGSWPPFLLKGVFLSTLASQLLGFCKAPGDNFDCNR